MTFLFFGQATTSAARPAPAAGACNPVGSPPSAPGVLSRDVSCGLVGNDMKIMK